MTQLNLPTPMIGPRAPAVTQPNTIGAPVQTQLDPQAAAGPQQGGAATAAGVQQTMQQEVQQNAPPGGMPAGAGQPGSDMQLPPGVQPAPQTPGWLPGQPNSFSPSGLLYNQGEGPITQQVPPMVATAMVHSPGKVAGEKLRLVYPLPVVDVELLATGQSPVFSERAKKTAKHADDVSPCPESIAGQDGEGEKSSFSRDTCKRTPPQRDVTAYPMGLFVVGANYQQSCSKSGVLLEEGDRHSLGIDPASPLRASAIGESGLEIGERPWTVNGPAAWPKPMGERKTPLRGCSKIGFVLSQITKQGQSSAVLRPYPEGGGGQTAGTFQSSVVRPPAPLSTPKPSAPPSVPKPSAPSLVPKPQGVLGRTKDEYSEQLQRMYTRPLARAGRAIGPASLKKQWGAMKKDWREGMSHIGFPTSAVQDAVTGPIGTRGDPTMPRGGWVEEKMKGWGGAFAGGAIEKGKEEAIKAEEHIKRMFGEGSGKIIDRIKGTVRPDRNSPLGRIFTSFDGLEPWQKLLLGGAVVALVTAVISGMSGRGGALGMSLLASLGLGAAALYPLWAKHLPERWRKHLPGIEQTPPAPTNQQATLEAAQEQQREQMQELMGVPQWPSPRAGPLHTWEERHGTQQRQPGLVGSAAALPQQRPRQPGLPPGSYTGQ